MTNCKISEHIPTENGKYCECGYFIQKELCVQLLIEEYEETSSLYEAGGNLATFKKFVEEKINKSIKPVEEIPQMKGTLEALDKLTPPISRM